MVNLADLDLHILMMKNIKLLYFSLLFILASNFTVSAQKDDLGQLLWETYPEFKEEAISERRINHNDITPLIDKLRQEPGFVVQKVGESIEGRELSLISIGEGETDIFLWSQMHGDESTATMAIFDIFNFLKSDSFKENKEELLENTTLHFLPMLNPDGAQDFQRRNALGIDVNRDALRLQSPEGKTLKRIRDSLDADFGFNLHDQSRYYNVGGTAGPATISFLAPAYNYEKSVNQVRGDAMKVIVDMNRVLQKYIPGQVGRYNDDFEPRAFGDNVQKWGTSAILIESGGYLNDAEKQEIRKLNFLAILSAVFSISNEAYKELEIAEYETIPWNNSKLFDLKLSGLNYELLGEMYILDLGINHYEVANANGYHYRGQIADQGDLSTNYGYATKDVSGYTLKPAKIYPDTIDDLEDLEEMDFSEILSEGYAYVRVKDISGNKRHISYPVQVVKENFEAPTRFGVGSNPTFFLEKDGNLDFAVINGFFVELKDPEDSVKNGLILK